MQIEQRYVLVPVEPTEAMVEAGTAAAESVEKWTRDEYEEYRWDKPWEMPKPVYSAMIAARPDSDMVERVARAISDYTYATIHGSTDCNEWEDMTDTDRAVYCNAARAAIAAITGEGA